MVEVMQHKQSLCTWTSRPFLFPSRTKDAHGVLQMLLLLLRSTGLKKKQLQVTTTMMKAVVAITTPHSSTHSDTFEYLLSIWEPIFPCNSNMQWLPPTGCHIHATKSGIFQKTGYPSSKPS